MKSGITFGLIAVGLCFLLLSGLWTTLFPATSTWTPEKATRVSEVNARIYNLAFLVNAPTPNLQRGQDLGQLKAEYEQLKKEKTELDSQFSSATDTPRTVSKFLKWAGISLAAVGVIGWYAVNQSR